MNDDQSEPLLVVNKDGSVVVGPDLAHHLMACTAQILGQVTEVEMLEMAQVASILGVAAGYTAGLGLPDRNKTDTTMDMLQDAMEYGMGLGMERNGGMPRCNA